MRTPVDRFQPLYRIFSTDGRRDLDRLRRFPFTRAVGSAFGGPRIALLTLEGLSDTGA